MSATIDASKVEVRDVRAQSLCSAMQKVEVVEVTNERATRARRNSVVFKEQITQHGVEERPRRGRRVAVVERAIESQEQPWHRLERVLQMNRRVDVETAACDERFKLASVLVEEGANAPVQ